jgi:hypothetical protein
VYRALTLIGLLAGRASLDRAECVSADWYTIGLEDGARGHGIEHLEALSREAENLEREISLKAGN